MRVAWQCESDRFRRELLALRWPGVPCYADVRDVRPDSVEPVDLLCGGFPCEDVSHIGLRAGIGGVKSGLWAHFARLVRDLRPRYVLVENVAGLLTGGGAGRVLGDLAASGYDAEWDCVPAATIGSPHLRARIWLLAYPAIDGNGVPQETLFAGRDKPEHSAWWATEPSVDRVADGLPRQVDRLGAVGDSLVPQIAEWIGRRLMEAE